MRTIKSGAIILKRKTTESERKNKQEYIELLEETASEGWAKKEGFSKVKYIIGGKTKNNPVADETGYMKLKSNTKDIIYRPNEFDNENFPADVNVKQCSIAVKSGDLIGYPGLFETPSKKEISVCHLEVFTKEESGLKDLLAGNILNEEKQRDYFVFEQRASLQQEYPQVLKGSWYVKLLSRGNKYSKIQIVEKRNIVNRDDDVKGYDGSSKTYKIKSDNFDTVNALFDGLLSSNSNLRYIKTIKTVDREGVEKETRDRLVSFTFTGKINTFWIENRHVPDEEEHEYEGEHEKKQPEFELSEAELSTLYNSEKEPVNMSSFSIPKTAIIKGTKGEVTDKDKTEWICLEYDKRQGWLKKDDKSFKKISAMKWDEWGFQIIKDDSDDFIYEGGKQGMNFVRQMHGKIDTDNDGTVSEKELSKALKNRTIAKQLSTMICYHRTEWGGKETASFFRTAYETLLDMVNKVISEEYRKRKKERLDTAEEKIINLGFFSEVDDLKSSPHIYHFHPIAFIEMMGRGNKEIWRTPIDNPMLCLYSQGGSEKPWHGSFGEKIRDNVGNHSGIDLFALPNTNVYACVDGIIAKAYTSTSLAGRVISLKVKDTKSFIQRMKKNFSSQYATKGELIDRNFNLGGDIYLIHMHLGEIKVTENQEVKCGDIIGLSGTSGKNGTPFATRNPHLHFEVSNNISSAGLNGKCNPIRFFDVKNENSLTIEDKEVQLKAKEKGY